MQLDFENILKQMQASPQSYPSLLLRLFVDNIEKYKKHPPASKIRKIERARLVRVFVDKTNMLMKQSNGLIIAPHRGKAPQPPEGYEATKDPFIFKPILVECEHRSFVVTNTTCCGRSTRMKCDLSTQYINYATCHEHCLKLKMLNTDEKVINTDEKSD
jgi:hypothetical protein